MAGEMATFPFCTRRLISPAVEVNLVEERGKCRRLPNGCFPRPTFWRHPLSTHRPVCTETEFCSFLNGLGLLLSSRDTSCLSGHISALRAGCFLCHYVLSCQLSVWQACRPFSVLSCGSGTSEPTLPRGHPPPHFPLMPLSLVAVAASLVTAFHKVLPWQPWSWHLTGPPHPTPS